MSSQKNKKIIGPGYFRILLALTFCLVAFFASAQAAEAAQYARPSADSSAGIWSPSTGSYMYATIDEVSASDTDYMISSGNAVGSGQVDLSSVTDPNSSTGHIIRVRAKQTGGNPAKQVTLQAHLYEGAILRASTVATDLPTNGSYVNISYTLSAAETDAISDYSNLKLTFEVTVNGGAGKQAYVTWAEFEVPEAQAIAPSAPTNVSATDGTYTDKVTLTWTKSAGATGYRVYRDGVDVSGLLGNVATYDDTGAGAGSITPGTVSATDGSSTSQVNLSVSGASANNGASHSYYVVAVNAYGSSPSSSTNTGYRGVGALSYQWQVSAGDSDASYSNISGATSASYGHSSAPAPTITPGTAVASDGTSPDHVALSLSGESANNGAGRYYKVILSATGASQQTSSANRGYRGVGPLVYQWQRSAADSDASYSDISGATTDPYNDTGAPADGSGRYFRALLSATGAANQTSAADRGYRELSTPLAPTNVSAIDGTYTDKVTLTWTKSVGATGYRVYRDGVDVSGLLGDVATYDDTGAGAGSITPGSVSATDGSSVSHIALSASGASVSNGATHTYHVVAVNASGNSPESSTNTGYRGVGALTYQWQVSAGDSDSSYSNISGATASTHNDLSAPAPTITPGTAVASDGTSPDYVTLDLSGESANNGAGRYYRLVLNATGATQQTSSANRGYRGVGPLVYQWQRSAADSDASYSDISGATTDPYNDTGAPEDGSGRYYKAVLSAAGAAGQTSSVDRGHRQVVSSDTTISGIAYDSEGGSALSSETVKVYKNGSEFLGSDVTDGSGAWSVTGSIQNGDIITVFLEDASDRGNTVYVSDGTTKTDVHIYGDALIVRDDTGAGISNSDLHTAAIYGESHLAYSTSTDNAILLGQGIDLYVWAGSTYAPGAALVIPASLNITSGSVFSAPTQTTIGKNFSNYGTFIHNGGAVTFDTTQISTIYSVNNMSFYDFRSVTPGKILKFRRHVGNIPTFTVEGAMTVTGENVGLPVFIESNTPGQQWMVYFSGPQSSINYASIRDSACALSSSGAEGSGTNSSRGNNGECWNFVNIGSDGTSKIPSVGHGRGWGLLRVGGKDKALITPAEGATGGGEEQDGGDEGVELPPAP